MARGRGRWRRRAISLGVLGLAASLTSVLIGPALVVAAIRDLVVRSRGAWVRALLFSAWLLFCELWGVAGLFLIWLAWPLGGRASFEARTVRLQRVWTESLLGGLRRLFSLEVAIEGDAVTAEGGFVLAARHTSSADPMLVMSAVPNRRGFRPHFALKAELLWDPCLDIAGHRFPNAFIRRGQGETELVAALADHLEPCSIVVIYPEGTRATPRRRARRLAQMRERADPLVELAERFEHGLPPHLGGLASLLDRQPEADVVFMAHAGLDGIRGVGDLFGGRLIGTRLDVALWRVAAAEIPSEPDARRQWLFEQWLEVDRKVGEWRAARE